MATPKTARLCLLFALLCGCAAQPKPTTALVPAPPGERPPVSALKPDIKEYRLGPDDLMRVDVFQVPGLSRKVRVNSGGEIALPLVGSLPVAGLTANEVEERIRAKLGERYLQNPQVSVSVEEFTSQRVVADGAFAHPGVYPLSGPTTLLQLFAQADGPTEYADIHNVRIFRTTADGKKQSLFYDIEAIRNGTAKDPALQGGDVVEVGEDTLKLVWKNIKETIRVNASASVSTTVK
jgi:polysaccharide export outer membrane protein